MVRVYTDPTLNALGHLAQVGSLIDFWKGFGYRDSSTSTEVNPHKINALYPGNDAAGYNDKAHYVDDYYNYPAYNTEWTTRWTELLTSASSCRILLEGYVFNNYRYTITNLDTNKHKFTSPISSAYKQEAHTSPNTSCTKCGYRSGMPDKLQYSGFTFGKDLPTTGWSKQGGSGSSAWFTSWSDSKNGVTYVALNEGLNYYFSVDKANDKIYYSGGEEARSKGSCTINGFSFNENGGHWFSSFMCCFKTKMPIFIMTSDASQFWGSGGSNGTFYGDSITDESEYWSSAAPSVAFGYGSAGAKWNFPSDKNVPCIVTVAHDANPSNDSYWVAGLSIYFR